MKSLVQKSHFPVLQDSSLVYLDSAASSLKPFSVLNAMDEYYYEYGVNVHRGVYKLSYIATEHYEKARQTVADFISASFEEIIFTKGASSALNLVASSYGLNNLTKEDEIIVSELEHHSHLLPWQNVSRITGAKLVYLPLDKDGRITIDGFLQVLSDKTKVVALTLTSNVMGYITPIKEIIALAHKKGAIVSVDAAQAAPHMKINVQDLDCDFLAFSGHKMLGPTGIGVLYGKRNLLSSMPPVEFGGDMNDNVEKYTATWKDVPYKFETGTPPIAEAIGFAKAIEYLEKIGLDQIHEHELSLARYVIKQMKEIDGIEIYNEHTDTGIISFNLTDVHPHDAITFFDQDNICMRAGHHCAQLVIKYLNVPATLRASFYLYNDKEDCDRFIDSLKRARTFFTEMGF
jgi:cysteine desulfurase/selenocysteine lyase